MHGQCQRSVPRPALFDRNSAQEGKVTVQNTKRGQSISSLQRQDMHPNLRTECRHAGKGDHEREEREGVHFQQTTRDCTDRECVEQWICRLGMGPMFCYST